MLKKYLSIFCSLAIVLLFFTACEKEALPTDAKEAIVLNETDQALNFLKSTTATMPFAVLELDHTTNQVEGFFIDNEANLRKITIEDAPYLDMSEITLDDYFMEQLHQQSALVMEIDPIEVMKQVQVAKSLIVHSDFTIAATTSTSKIFLLFTENLQGNNHNRDCIGGNRHSMAGTYNKVLIAGNGQINYEAKTAQGKSLVQWLQLMEELVDN